MSKIQLVEYRFHIAAATMIPSDDNLPTLLLASSSNAQCTDTVKVEPHHWILKTEKTPTSKW